MSQIDLHNNVVDINKFKKAVDTVAKKQESYSIEHFGPEQSAIVLGTIFKYSNDIVKMYVGDLNGDISNHKFYIEQFKNFIVRGGKVKVLIQNDNSINRSSIKSLLDMYSSMKENVNILDTSKTLTYTNDTGEREFHFAIGDNKFVRIENDIDKYSGFASFNAPELANNLNDLFDDIYTSEERAGKSI